MVQWPMPKRTFGCIGLLIVGVSASAFAETIITRCEFTREASPDGVKTQKPLLMVFAADTVNQKYFMLGNTGDVVECGGVANDGAFSWIEITKSGNIMSTTVGDNGVAVHSRHVWVPAAKQFIPSQWYGRCTSQPLPSEVPETLDTEAMVEGLSAVEANVRACGIPRTGIESATSIETVSVELLVNSDGNVSSSRLKTTHDTPFATRLSRCVRAAVVQAHFVKTKTGATITKKYEFVISK